MWDAQRQAGARLWKVYVLYSPNHRANVIGGSGVLVSKEEEFSETCPGGCSSLVWFTDDVQLRGFPPNIPVPHLHPFCHGKGLVLCSVGPG